MKEFYREFTCVVCGRKAIDRGKRQDAKLCSEKCRNKYFYHNPGGDITTKHLCLHNVGVSCENHQCDGCGWNPDVQKARKEKIMDGVGYGEE